MPLVAIGDDAAFHQLVQNGEQRVVLKRAAKRLAADERGRHHKIVVEMIKSVRGILHIR